MNFILRPSHLLSFVLAGWISRNQQEAIEYLLTENRVLREKLGRRRILLNDDQRRRLAAKAKLLGRKRLLQLATVATPDTLLRWHRQLIAFKWNYSDRRQRVGRPRIRQEVVDLLVRMAKENSDWGYDRLQGALANVGIRLSDSTVANILKAHGIEPAPERKRRQSWGTFLKAHWETMAAADFTTVEVWTRTGLVTFYVFAVMRLKTRRVEVAGFTAQPNSAWMTQVGRNLTDCVDGFLRETSYLIIDRDTKHLPLRHVLEATKTKAVLLPPKSPNLNAHIERYFRSLKSECLSQMIFFGEESLRLALKEFNTHYHQERNHQGLDNRIIEPGDEVGTTKDRVQCRQRLGGMLRYYYREAA
jgi:transposase InsO family protein